MSAQFRRCGMIDTFKVLPVEDSTGWYLTVGPCGHTLPTNEKIFIMRTSDVLEIVLPSLFPKFVRI